MQGLGSWVEATVDLERREIWVGTSIPEIVAGEGFKQTPFLEDVDDVGTTVRFSICTIGDGGRDEEMVPPEATETERCVAME